MTKLNRMWIPVFVLVLLCPLAARAASIEAKSVELDTRFSFQHNNVSIDTGFGNEDFGITVFDIQAGVGYFFNPHWELAGNLLVNHVGVDGSSITDFGLQANGYYHFATSGAAIPFVGAGLGFLIHGGDVGDRFDDTELIIPELVAGVRFPFREVVSLNLSAGYRHIDSPYGYEDGSGNEFFMGFGFSYFLRGGSAR